MSNEAETVAFPVIEEKLKLGRETVETGRVRVRTEAEERTETVNDFLLRTNVAIERKPMDLEVGEVPPVREEGDTIVVPVVEERIIKKLFLVEEVRLSRRASQEEVQHEIQLRSQRVVVEREESGGGQQQ